MRDTLEAGHGVVSGGIYVSARLGSTRPGDTTTGAGSPQMVDVSVQAVTWFDVTAIDGTKALEPVHPGETPFGVTNPIFVTP